MITLHHLENSRSQRIIWLLEELGVDYDIKHYKRDPVTSLAPPELIKVHSLGKAPILTDGNKTIAESGVIIDYLISQYGQGKFKPDTDTDSYWQYQYWIQFAEGSITPNLVMSLIFTRIKEAKVPFFIKPIAKGIANQVMKGYVSPNIDKMLALIEQHLSQHTWFAGDELSGADFQMIFPLETALQRADKAAQLPNITAFVKRVHALPAYQKGLEKGGPYAYA